MYEVLKLYDELRKLNAVVKSGEATRIVIDRIFEIQMLLDNVYCYEF